MTLLTRETPFAHPIKVIQFGEGNFLRAFVDWQIDILNERAGLDAGVVVVRPISRPGFPLLDSQDGVYTTLIRGLDEVGKPVRDFRKITSVAREVDLGDGYDDFLALAHIPTVRFIVSNTTEAGIAVNDGDRYDDRPPSAYPAKLTRLLHERFKAFAGADDKGVIVMPCELIDHNGDELKAAVEHFAALWQLGDAFLAWLNGACIFCSTLVDRIVTGYPREELDALDAELGYEDRFLVTAEYFHLFVIEGPASVGEELRIAGSGLNILLTSDITPYKQRKVGVLNGSHTTMVPVGLLAGLEAVREAVDDPDVGPFLMRALDREIIPTLPLPRAELESFAADVLRRFRNPYIHHRMEAIALNSWSKYAARVLPQLLTYSERNGRLPVHLVTTLAATLRLYRGDTVKLADDPAILAWFADAWAKVDSGALPLAAMVENWLANERLWGRNLNAVPGLAAAVAEKLAAIGERGMRTVLKTLATDA
jgi:tagaturonate reductase